MNIFAGMMNYNILSDKEIAEKAREIILEDLSVYDSVPVLADKIGVSVKTLKRAFKHIYKLSVSRFSRQERIAYAKKLLAETNYTVHTIGESCGYTEGTNFQTAFKEVIGMTPGEWRKESDHLS